MADAGEAVDLAQTTENLAPLLEPRQSLSRPGPEEFDRAQNPGGLGHQDRVTAPWQILPEVLEPTLSAFEPIVKIFTRSQIHQRPAGEGRTAKSQFLFGLRQFWGCLPIIVSAVIP